MAERKKSTMAEHGPGRLVRVIGRWSLTGLLINLIVGSGVFGLPSVVASKIGQASPWGYLLAAAGIGVIMGCFAEVASQFPETGGPYLYAREAFGPFIGIQTGWLLWLLRLTAVAAGANLFTSYLAFFIQAVAQPAGRAITLTLLIGILAAINYVGVSAGAKMSNLFVVVKLMALFGFALGGLAYMRLGSTVSVVSVLPASAPLDKWLDATLLMVFAYGGFEAGLVSMGEVRDPRRDTPFAIWMSLLTVTILYSLIQFTVVHTLANPSASDRPLAAAARQIFGPAGAALMTTCALLSLYGYLTSNMLAVPRVTFALAERGDFPGFFAAVHPRFRTPHVSIVLYAIIVWALALWGNFRWNVQLSAVARLFAYGLVCAALPVLRRKRPQANAYRLPGGQFLALLGVAFALVLITRMSWKELIVVAITASIALMNWLAVRRRSHASTAPASSDTE